MREKMKKMLVMLLFVLGLFLFGCTTTLPQTQYVCLDGTVVTNASLCTAAAAPSAPVTPAATSAPITLDTELEACSGMPELQGASLEELCISGLAAKHENVSLCKKLSYDGRRTCYLLLATVMNDADVCANAGADKDNCYQQYATNANDASVCDKITNVDNKDGCYANIASKSGDATLCDKIKSAGQKNSCYFNMAMRFRDTTYCDKITESGQKQNCLQNIQR